MLVIWCQQRKTRERCKNKSDRNYNENPLNPFKNTRAQQPKNIKICWIPWNGLKILRHTLYHISLFFFHRNSQPILRALRWYEPSDYYEEQKNVYSRVSIVWIVLSRWPENWNVFTYIHYEITNSAQATQFWSFKWLQISIQTLGIKQRYHNNIIKNNNNNSSDKAIETYFLRKATRLLSHLTWRGLVKRR